MATTSNTSVTANVWIPAFDAGPGVKPPPPQAVAVPELKVDAPPKFVVVTPKLVTNTYSNITVKDEGGKAASLNKLFKAGYRVPQAWVIPCKASVMEERPKIKLHAVIPPTKQYAVRSGAPVSMPGLLETKLNVGYNELNKAIRAVWESWNGEPAKLYREAKGLDHGMGTAVTIQDMIKAKFAGVAFTNNPNNYENKGKFDPLIEFVVGLGEQLVSGDNSGNKPTGEEPWYPELVAHLHKMHKAWGPSDVEWVVDETDVLWFVQQRALRFNEPAGKAVVIEDRVLLASGMAIGHSSVVAAKMIVAGYGNPDPGDVLYVTSFNTAYYPMMLKAGAIICGQGGETCHAAIIGRELGKPAVSNVELAALGGTKHVIVDGASGSVYAALPGDLEKYAAGADGPVVKYNPPRPDFSISNREWNVNHLMFRFYKALDDEKNNCITTERKDQIVGEIAHIIGTYYYITPVCEMRHMQTKSTSSDSKVDVRTRFQQKGVRIPQIVTRPDRVTFLSKGIPPPLSVKRAIEVLELCVEGFSKLEWPGGFGGGKWAEIAKLALQYYKGEISNTLFLDRCFNMVHNGGRIFNKFTWMSCNDATMKLQLDFKAKSFKDLDNLVRGNYYNSEWVTTVEAERLLDWLPEPAPDQEEVDLEKPLMWDGDEEQIKKKEEEKALLAKIKEQALAKIESNSMFNGSLCNCVACLKYRELHGTEAKPPVNVPEPEPEPEVEEEDHSNCHCDSCHSANTLPLGDCDCSLCTQATLELKHEDTNNLPIEGCDCDKCKTAYDEQNPLPIVTEHDSGCNCAVCVPPVAVAVSTHDDDDGDEVIWD